MPALTPGTTLLVTSIVHNAFALIEPRLRRPLTTLLKNGLVNTLHDNGPVENMTAFWFVAFGFMMGFAGRCMTWYEDGGKRRLPKEAGWWMVGIGLVGGLMMPASGFWTVVPQGIWILIRARKDKIK